MDMKKPNQFLKRAGRVVAGVNVLFNLATAPKPPDLQLPARTQELQSQWAKNEITNVLPSWRNRAQELGYQLREPASGEYRPREDTANSQLTSKDQRAPKERDSHDQALSKEIRRGGSRTAGVRSDKSRRRPSGGQARSSQGREGQGR